MLKNIVIWILAILVTMSSSFNLEISHDDISVKTGDSFFLSCKADSSYEFCTFRSPNGVWCDYEWKRSEWNVTQGECAELHDRVTFSGIYEDHECAILVHEALISDSGVWSCEVESYYLGGSKGSGSVRIGEFNVEVLKPTTTTTTTTTTSTTSTTTSPIASFHKNRSGRKLDSFPDYEFLPNTTRLDLPLNKATALPLVVGLVLVMVTIAAIAILVMVHRMKNGSVSKVISLEAGQMNISFEENKEEKQEKNDQNMDEVRFMQDVFPHIINFPKDDLGLNL